MLRAFVVKLNGLYGTTGVWVKYGIFYHEATMHTKFAVPDQHGDESPRARLRGGASYRPGGPFVGEPSNLCLVGPPHIPHRQRMMRLHQPLQPLGQHMRVDLRCNDIRMTKQHL